MKYWQIKTYLTYQKGFTWHTKGACSVKGYMFTPEGNFLSGDKLASYFSGINNIEEIKSVISNANGQFSLIIVLQNQCLLAVDPIRTFPVLYSTFDNTFFISDSFNTLMNHANNVTWNQVACEEYLAAGYVTGKETLSEEIHQVRAGELVTFNIENGELQEEFYYTYQTDSVFEATEEDLSVELEGILERVGQRLIASLQGRHAIVSLSGGYDSRLIASMLKSAGYQDVTCLTYGRKGNPDMLIAEKVAKELSYNWLCVEYNDELINNYTTDPDFHKYYQFAANGISMFYLQDYFAIKYLKENASVPDDAIFIPGHTGDFLAGTNIIKHNLKSGHESNDELVRRILRTKYIFCPISHPHKAIIENRIHKTLVEKQIVDKAFSYTIHEDWDMKERLTKLIVNSARVYDWFGYNYRLPFWDNELTGFFRQVPYELKENRRLFDSVLRKSYFSRYNIDFPVEIRPSERHQRNAYIRSQIKHNLPQLFKRFFLNKEDPIFYYEITRELQRNMERKGILIRPYNNSFNSLIMQWYVERLKSETGPGSG